MYTDDITSNYHDCPPPTGLLLPHRLIYPWNPPTTQDPRTGYNRPIQRSVSLKRSFSLASLSWPCFFITSDLSQHAIWDPKKLRAEGTGWYWMPLEASPVWAQGLWLHWPAWTTNSPAPQLSPWAFHLPPLPSFPELGTRGETNAFHTPSPKCT